MPSTAASAQQHPSWTFRRYLPQEALSTLDGIHAMHRTHALACEFELAHCSEAASLQANQEREAPEAPGSCRTRFQHTTLW